MTRIKRLILILTAGIAATLMGAGIASAGPFLTGVGGTGTSTPSGILYGDNGATTHLNTLTVGANLSFSGGVLSNVVFFPFTPSAFGLTPSNATSTLIGFDAGLYALASSTIGGGTQITGLTVLGGATTTGRSYFAGNVTMGNTENSTYPLQVVSPSTATVQPVLALQNINGGGNGGISILFGNSSSLTAKQAAIGSIRTNTPTSGNTALVFVNHNPITNACCSFSANASPQERMRINGTGNIGVSSSTPYAELSIHAQSYDLPTTLFAIGSSTAAATTTIFAIDNTGAVQLPSNRLQFDQSTATTSFGAISLGNVSSQIGTSTGMEFYNTADQSTNGERVDMGWASNAFNIRYKPFGSGVARILSVSAQDNTGSGAFLNFSASPAAGNGNLEATRSTSGAVIILGLGGSFTPSSGTSVMETIHPTINHSGSAGYSMLRIQPTETAVGTGAKYLIQAGTSTATDLFDVTNAGNVGIGTSSPQYKLSIQNLQEGNTLQLYDPDGNCLIDPDSAGLTTTCTSDQSLKTNIVDTNLDALKFFMDFRIRDYTMIATGRPFRGVIAQELELTHPELVHDIISTTTYQVRNGTDIDGNPIYDTREATSSTKFVTLPTIWDAVKAIQQLVAALKGIFRTATGAPTHVTGMTLYDTATNQPYCVAITNAVLGKTTGACQ